MFDTLVISTREPRKGRTVKFLLGTSMTYLLATAAAISLSVYLANPRLADGRDLANPIFLAPPPPPQGGSAPRSAQPQQQAAARSNMYKPAPLDQIIERNATVQPVRPFSSEPPVIGPIGSGTSLPSGSGGGTGTGTGIGDGIPNGIGPAGALDVPLPPPVQREQPKPRPAETQGPVRIASSVLQGKAIERRTPPYPLLAKQIKVEGAVAVEIIISPDGRVESARAISGHHLLIRAAEEAARGWRFQPTLLNGQPARAAGIITFNFRLN